MCLVVRSGPHRQAGVAQLVEQLIRNQQVVRSIRIAGSSFLNNPTLPPAQRSTRQCLDPRTDLLGRVEVLALRTMGRLHPAMSSRYHPETTVGPAFSRKGQRPVTRGQRVVFLVFGCLFVLYGVMGG